MCVCVNTGPEGEHFSYLLLPAVKGGTRLFGNIMEGIYTHKKKILGKCKHTCQVLGKSKSEIARAPLIFVYNLVIERAEKSGAQVLRVRFFSLFKQT